MYITDFYISLIIGLLLSLIVTEIFGVIPGGVIVPGYLAIVCNTPSIIILSFLISFIVFGITKYILPKFVILYGRRRFVTLMVLSILIKLSFELLFPVIPFVTFEFRGIGVVVPALIANCYFKQGVKLTFLSTIIVTSLTFGIVSVLYYFI